MSDDSWDDEDPFADPRPSRPPAPDRNGRVSRPSRDDDPFGEDTPQWLSYDNDTVETDVDLGEGTRAWWASPRWLVAGIAAVVALSVAGLMINSANLLDDPRAAAPTSGPDSPDARAPAPTLASTGTPSSPAPQTTPPVTPSTPSSSVEPVGVLVADALNTLEVKGRAPGTGYAREAFGQEWADVDRNGCDTRNDILRRDLDAVEVRTGTFGCLVERGTLVDPYSGERLSFERGWETSILVQIDHVVSLSNAWQTGAQYWTSRRRERFANDPLNLLAVDGSLNQQKSDGDAATWLPPDRGYWCRFVSRQVAVKAKYGLWVTRPERDAILRVLTRCPNEPLVTRSQ